MQHFEINRQQPITAGPIARFIKNGGRIIAILQPDPIYYQDEMCVDLWKKYHACKNKKEKAEIAASYNEIVNSYNNGKEKQSQFLLIKTD